MRRTLVPALWISLGAVLGAGVKSAVAQSPPRASIAPVDTALRCRHFPVDPANSDRGHIDTDDATTEIGQWVRSQSGWQTADVDFEMGIKGNGFPSSYVQVCLRKAP